MTRQATKKQRTFASEHRLSVLAVLKLAAPADLGSLFPMHNKASKIQAEPKTINQSMMMVVRAQSEGPDVPCWSITQKAAGKDGREGGTARSNVLSLALLLSLSLSCIVISVLFLVA